MSLDIGQVLEGKYRVVRLIGQGGMGAVFEGENLRVRRRVAIKVLHRRAANNEETIQRFEREAQTAGQIGSDHILEVTDFGALPGGERFMIMEFLDGEPLSARIAKAGRIVPRDLVPLLLQVLEGLDAAHAAGIVHRDLKPDNIFVLREKAGVRDFVKLIDFGISKVQNTTGDALTLTKTGAVMGTPYYLSPEQANGSHDADARSDIYSLGVIVYEAVTGRVPFHARSFTELLFKIVLADPIPPEQLVPEIDPAFSSLVMKAMARDPAFRFQSASEFAQALEAWRTEGRGVQAPPRSRATLGLREPSQPEVTFDSSPVALKDPALSESSDGVTSLWRRASAPPKWSGFVWRMRWVLAVGLALIVIVLAAWLILNLAARTHGTTPPQGATTPSAPIQAGPNRVSAPGPGQQSAGAAADSVGNAPAVNRNEVEGVAVPPSYGDSEGVRSQDLPAASGATARGGANVPGRSAAPGVAPSASKRPAPRPSQEAPAGPEPEIDLGY